VLDESDLQRRRLLRKPFTASQILLAGQTALDSGTTSRCWTLPETKFADEVDHYKARHAALLSRTPCPEISSPISPATAEEIATRVDAALRLLELGKDSGLLIKPILLYYAYSQVVNVYTRSYLRWRRDKQGHGLKCQHSSSDVGDTKVVVQDGGQFIRLAISFFLFSGQPNLFSPLVTHSSQPLAHRGQGEILEQFGKIEIGVPEQHFTVRQLQNYDIHRELEKVKVRHGYHKFSGRPTSEFLLDSLKLFVASSLARYDPIGWNRIMDGKDNSYLLVFEEAFDRFANRGFDVLLELVEKPTLNLTQALQRVGYDN
jgi:hypothetical protein